MKSLKTILAIIIISLIIISCSKDDDSKPITPTYLLSKITYSSSQNTSYTYDDSNKLIIEESLFSSGSIFRTTFKYNNSGKIIEKLKIPIAGNNPSIEKQTFEYDSQNRLVKRNLFGAITSSPDEFALDSSEIFSYNQNSIEYKYKSSNTTFATSRVIYELNQGGNFLLVKGYRSLTADDQTGVLDWESTIEYDTKNNPLSSLPDEYVFLEKTKNNQTKRNTPQFSPTIETITYEYNQDGYPTKSINGNRTTIFEYIVK